MVSRPKEVWSGRWAAGEDANVANSNGRKTHTTRPEQKLISTHPTAGWLQGQAKEIHILTGIKYDQSHNPCSLQNPVAFYSTSAPSTNRTEPPPFPWTPPSVWCSRYHSQLYIIRKSNRKKEKSEFKKEDPRMLILFHMIVLNYYW